VYARLCKMGCKIQTTEDASDLNTIIVQLIVKLRYLTPWYLGPTGSVPVVVLQVE